jgi:hypothetical protein
MTRSFLLVDIELGNNKPISRKFFDKQPLRNMEALFSIKGEKSFVFSLSGALGAVMVMNSFTVHQSIIVAGFGVIICGEKYFWRFCMIVIRVATAKGENFVAR